MGQEWDMGIWNVCHVYGRDLLPSASMAVSPEKSIIPEYPKRKVYPMQSMLEAMPYRQYHTL